MPKTIIDPRCTRLIDGFSGGYKYLERGNTTTFQDKPDKNIYSHCLAGDTLVSTTAGAVPIRELTTGMLVDTPKGPRRILATMNRKVSGYYEVGLSNGKTIRATGDHPFYTEKGIVRADALQYNDALVGINTVEAKKWAEGRKTQLLSSKESGTTESRPGILSRIITSMEESICTALYGSFIAVQSLRLTAYTILTPTNPTIALKTLLSMVVPVTRVYTQEGIIETYQSGCVKVSRLLKRPQKNGMDQKLAGSGTESTESARGKEGRKNRSTAFSAVRSIGRIVLHAKEVFAGCLARTKTDAPKVSGSVLINEPIIVYDITVEDAHCFFAEGVLVSNCHDAVQYVALKLFGYAEHNPKLWTEPLKVEGVTGA
jgi:hypothetical protein